MAMAMTMTTAMIPVMMRTTTIAMVSMMAMMTTMMGMCKSGDDGGVFFPLRGGSGHASRREVGST
eukprot:3260271-Rhodomonas_salina.3